MNNAMKNQLTQTAKAWATRATDDISPEHYCETRDIFQSRLDIMLQNALRFFGADEAKAYLLTAIVGEIGSNSFDHNLGNWADVPGIFFGYSFPNDGEWFVVLADRGQGILKTLRHARPSLANDLDALKVAFTEKLSGRAPEDRGNGLKFVRNGVQEESFHLFFSSGTAKAKLNAETNFSESEEGIHGCFALLSK